MKHQFLIILFFTLSFAIITIKTSAQKGLNIEIIVNPGFSMGGDFQIDVSTGLQDSWMSLPKSSTFGFNGGTAIGYNFNDHVGLCLNMLTSKKGQNYDDYTFSELGISYTWKRKVSLSYISIPLLFQYTHSIDKRVSFIGSVGVYTGILLNYKDENSINFSNIGSINSVATGTNYTSTVDGNIFIAHDNGVFQSEPYNSVDFGGIIEAGFQYNISDKISIPILINYQIGFIDIKNKNSMYTYTNSTSTHSFWGDPDNNPNSTLSYHNSFLGLKIGVKINLSK